MPLFLFIFGINMYFIEAIMQQLNEFQTYLHNLVSSLNTALVLSRKLGEKVYSNTQ